MTSAGSRKNAKQRGVRPVQADSPTEIPHRAFADTAACAFVLQFDLPIVIVSPSGEVLWATESARQRLVPPLPVFLDGSRLRFGDFADDSVADRLSLIDDKRRHLLCGEVSSGQWVLMWGWAERIHDQRVLVLAFRMARPLRGCEESGLAEQFRLTKGECVVVDRFARMEPPKKIAEHLGVTVDTVRTHLKRVHAKVGATSNVQLLQMVRAYCDA